MPSAEKPRKPYTASISPCPTGSAVQRIAPLQRGEAGEVRVRAVQLVTAADRQSGQVGVGSEVAGGAEIAKEVPEQCEVSRRRLGHVHVRQREPRGKTIEDIRHG